MFARDNASSPAAFIAALKMQDTLCAVTIAKDMVLKNLPLDRQWQAISRFAMTEAEWPLAVAAAQCFVAGDAASLDRQLFLADVMMNAGWVGRAVALLQPLITTSTTDCRILHFLGVAQLELGEPDAGLEYLRAALAARPASAATWLALANAKRFTRGDPEFEALRRVEAAANNAAPDDRAALHYAMGKAWDDLMEFDRAFVAFANGAEILAASRRYDAAADQAAAVRSTEGLDHDWLKRNATKAGSRALFVAGKPRSGTTLLAQVLTAHSSVSAGGETGILALAARLTQMNDAATLRYGHPIDDPWREFRDRHRYLVDARFGPGDSYVVDKSLDTSRHLAAIRLGLSDSPLFWVRRDAIDTAWSSFRTCFSRGLNWSFELKAMAQHHAIEDWLYAFWRQHFGDRLMTLEYSTLVKEPEKSISRLLAHAGLPDEAGVRKFHMNEGAVQTASVSQVRKPINQSGLNSSAAYQTQMVPYIVAYDAARRNLGLPTYG